MRLLKRTCERLLTAALAFSFAAAPIAAPARGDTTISGRILDAQAGLPVPNAQIELDRGGTKVAGTVTDAGGVFTFKDEPGGTYSFVIRAAGYETTRAPDLVIEAGQPEVEFQTAINRETGGLKQIAQVANAGRTSMQTSTTINTHIDTSILTDENFQRLGDVLTAVPGVITSTSSSVGDDMSLSIRGFDPTETATLLDGHPIGPIGAFGGGYNYNVSPFWGLSGADVVFGSGATGLYGATTIAGAVNFQTISPTKTPQISLTQGVGSNSKLLTGLLATGTLGKLGYALADGVQGTYGNFAPGYRLQTAFLQGSVVPGHQAVKNTPQPADLTTANVENNQNFYNVTGDYLQRNFVGKLQYDFSGRTSIAFTSYAANDWSDSTGEGDNDYQTYPFVLYNAQQAIASFGGKETTKLANGKKYTCVDSLVVLVNSASGATCMNAQQYAANLSGPSGGGYDRWRTLGNQDYDTRVTQTLGAGTLVVDGYVDAYNYNEQKGPGATGGPFFTNVYTTHGILISDEYASSSNDVAFGYSFLNQAHTGSTFPFVANNGSTANTFQPLPDLGLTTASYFVREAWSPNLKFSAYANLWLQRSYDTSSTHFNPRLSFVYRPDANDVFRITGGRAYSEPDPSLIFQTTAVTFGAPQSLNPTCAPGTLNTIAGVANPDLQPETATDAEIAYGHRFSSRASFQVAAYDSWEQSALLNGNVPISSIPQIPVPGSFITGYLKKIQHTCGGTPTIADLGYTTTFNAASARYRGIDLTAGIGILRNLNFNTTFDIQSSFYEGIPTDILQQNSILIDGSQFAGVPLRMGTAGLAYQNASSGFAARLDANYIGGDNSFNRAPFWFANASVSKTSGRVSVNFGVYNLFNSAAQQYGLIGAGVFQQQNQYFHETSALEQGTEQFGLPFRSVWLTVKTGI
jgi:outer membrane receptor protein involved in Fe transport